MPTASESHGDDHGSEHEQENKYPLPKEHEKAQESYASPAKSADSYETESSHESAQPPAPPKSSDHFESGGDHDSYAAPASAKSDSHESSAGHDSYASKPADQHSESAPSHGLSFQMSIPASPKHVVTERNYWREMKNLE